MRTLQQLDNIERWAAELESGRWRQATGALRKDDEQGACYCCLGVACVLFGDGEWEDNGGWRYQGSAATPGVSFMKRHFGINSGGGQWADDPHAHLTSANDNGKTFPEIAAIIRREFGVHAEHQRARGHHGALRTTLQGIQSRPRREAVRREEAGISERRGQRHFLHFREGFSFGRLYERVEGKS